MPTRQEILKDGKLKQEKQLTGQLNMLRCN
jgi:hypothetical protein